MTSYTVGSSTSNGPAGVDLTKTYDVPEFAVGTKVEFTDGSIFRFVAASKALSVGVFYPIGTDWVLGGDFLQGATGTQTNAPFALGVPQQSTSAPSSGYTYRYLWVQTAGAFSYAKVCAGTVKDNPLFISSACGALTSIVSATGSIMVQAIKGTMSSAVVGISGSSTNSTCYANDEIWITVDGREAFL